MANFKNNVVIAGNLVDVNLRMEEKVTRDTNEPYTAILGTFTLSVPSENETSNIQLRTFAKEYFNSGKENPSFKIFKSWLTDISEHDGLLTNFKDKMYRVNTKISGNAFLNQQGELVEAVQIQAGFLNSSQVGLPRAEFTADALITSTPTEVIKNEEPTGDYNLNVTLFDDYSGSFPCSFTLKDPRAVEYFEGLDASQGNPVLIEIWGKIINNEIETKKVVESAFGEPLIEVSSITISQRVITGAALEPKEITDEVQESMDKLKSAYELRVASVQETPSNGVSFDAPKKESKPSGGFNF